MVLVRAAAVGADESDGVRVVDHDHRVVTLGQLADLRERRHVAVHREHAIRDHHAETCLRAVLQLALEVVHVAVGVAESFGLAKPDAVDDARVVQRVGYDRVPLVEQRLEDPAVGVEAGRVEDRVLGAQELGQRRLELFVHLLRAADETDRGHAVAPAIQRFPRRRDNCRMIGQPQVVVGAQVQHITFRDADRRALRSRDDALWLLKARAAYLLELLGEMGSHSFEHQELQSKTTLPHCPLCATAKASLYSR